MRNNPATHKFLIENSVRLAVFAKVAEVKSFTKAAEALGLSKSAVSKHVAGLEERLKARLLQRTTRRLSLTEVGTALFARAQRIVAEVEEAERAVTTLSTEPRGTLRVSAPMSFGIRHLGPLVAEFMARYPELSVEMILNDRMVDIVEDGFDLAIRIAKLPDSSLIARKLCPGRRVVCASPDYWRRHGIPKTPADLKGHNCLMYTYLLNPGELRFDGPAGPLTIPVAGTLHSNNGDILRSAALAGIGFYFAPTFLVGDDVRLGRLERVLPEYDDTSLSIYAVYPHNRHLSAKVRAFIDFLAERFGGEPPWDQGLATAG
jgi:DNA-binding transcriptional LysR family regulator